MKFSLSDTEARTGIHTLHFEKDNVGRHELSRGRSALMGSGFASLVAARIISQPVEEITRFNESLPRETQQATRPNACADINLAHFLGQPPAETEERKRRREKQKAGRNWNRRDLEARGVVKGVNSPSGRTI